MLGAGVALGFVSHLIGLGHPKATVLKIFIALPLALLGIVLLHRRAVGGRPILLLAGLGAAAAMLSIHYFDYRAFPHTLGPRLRDVIEAQIIRQMPADRKEQARTSEEEAAKFPLQERKKLEQASHEVAEKQRRIEEILEPLARKFSDPEKESEMEPVFRRFEVELSAVRARIRAQGTEKMALGQHYQGLEPVVDPWIGDLGFWGNLDLRADQGVTLDIFGAKVHLGYVASFVYWIGEVVIAGFIAGGIMYKTAAVLRSSWFQRLTGSRGR